MRANYQRLPRSPLELRLKIVREYLAGESSREKPGLRYRVKPGTISQVHRYGNAEKIRIFGVGKRNVRPCSTDKENPSGRRERNPQETFEGA